VLLYVFTRRPRDRLEVTRLLVVASRSDEEKLASDPDPGRATAGRFALRDQDVLWDDFLALAAAVVNAQKGRAVTLYLVVEAADGYRAVFALAEFDPAFTDRVILLADRRDGQALSSRDGPLLIVVPDEKRYARWVQQAIALRVGRA
jgi:hypothetical protein